jgi:two-component system sensor histidine kinase QseC
MDGAGTPSTTGFSTVEIGGSAWRVFAAQGAKRDVRVYVGEEVASRASILWALMRSMFWSMFIALPVLALAAWWAVYSGVAPLRRLGRVLAGRQPHALDPVLLQDAPAEMAPMLDALNGLFERIARLMEAERRFTADAAHELRTPIAAIRAQAQVALGEADDARRRHALQSTLAGCDRAARLVEQMLTLSRLEAGIAPTAATVYLGAVVRQVVGELAPQALHKRQTIEVDAVDACAVTGDATLLALLVRNLVDNAIRYSPPGAKIRIAVADVDAQVRLLVEDSGQGMSTQDMQRFGERFFRVTGSGQSGSGLGASIVMRIADAHGAFVQASTSPLGGLAVTLTWPPG